MRFLKWLDGFLGPLAVWALLRLVKAPKTAYIVSKVAPSPKILVIRPGGIGDAALLLPTLRALKNQFSESEIDVLAEKRNAGVFSECKFISAVFLYDDFTSRGLFKTLKNSYDIVIDTEQWHRFSGCVAYLTKAQVRIGFATNSRKELFSHPVAYSHDTYEAQSFLDLLLPLSEQAIEFEEETAFIEPSSAAPEDFADFRKRMSCQDRVIKSRRIIGIFAGATVRERKWGADNFASLCRSLLENGGSVVILGGPGDADEAEEILIGIDSDKTLNLTGKTTLAETSAVLKEIDLLVTSDSGIMHMAYGIGTPTVSLFGAGIEEKWAPRGPSHIAVNHRLSCSPCTKFGYTPGCPYDVRCLKEIGVDEVIEAVNSLLKSTP